jgi:adenylate kinase
MKAIIITGSVCSGKSTLAKQLAEAMNIKYLDVNEIIAKHPEVVANYDKEMDTKDIDTNKLNKILIGLIESSKSQLVIDSHLSHFLSKKCVKVCIVTKCDLKEIKKRLEKRKYSEKKIRENLDCEIFDTCFIEAIEQGHKVILVDTTNGFNIQDIIANLQ